MKKAFSLFELILVLLISSIVLIYSLKFAKELQEEQVLNQKIAVYKIDMNSTKIIIEKNLENILTRLRLDNSTLYLDENILLQNVSSFSISQNSNILTVKIVLDDTISQTWEFKIWKNHLHYFQL